MSETLLARKLWETEQRRKALEAEAKALKEEYEATSGELSALLVESGKSSTGHIEGVGEFTIVRKTFPSVPKVEMSRFVEFLRGRGDGGIVYETVDHQTLGAYLRNLLDDLAQKIDADTDFRDDLLVRFSPADAAIESRELAARYLRQFGIHVYSECKLSHTKKGK